VDNKKASIMNCTNKEYHSAWSGGIVRDEATEEVIQEFSEQQGLHIDIARKYFNKTCMCCDKKLKKDDIALSMKYYGRQIEQFKCKKCIGKEFGITNKELKEKIQEFKSDGCQLF
jgi:aconitase A